MSSDSSQPQRTVAPRACDACYIRKVKCELIEPLFSQVDDGTTLPCKQCRSLRMACTFNRVRQRRPRRRKVPALSIESETPTSHPIIQRPDKAPIPPESPYSSLTSPLATSATPASTGSTSTVSTRDQNLFGIHRIGTREVFDLMIKDYLDLIYPLMPLVHRPTFRNDVASNRAERDPLFYSLLLSICAAVVTLLPRRFLEYKKAAWLFEFSNPYELIVHLEDAINRLRERDYFETPSVEKCAIPCFLGSSFGSVNRIGKASMHWSEMWVFLRALGANRPDSYKTLDYVEAQMRKKALWLYVFPAVHERLGGFHPNLPDTSRWQPIPDNMLFDFNNINQLMPLELDDEYIFPSTLQRQPASEIPLVSGFIYLVKVFLCFFPVEGDPACSENTSSESSFPHHRSEVETLQRMYKRVRHVLDNVSPNLAPWQQARAAGNHQNLRDPFVTKVDQLESIRANLQVTRLWAQSIILERLTAMSEHTPDERALWSERENSCEQLLHILYNINKKNIEPNGISVTFKIRQVAAPLLNCPFEEHTNISLRARLYIERFVELLAAMDKYSFQDTQLVVWNNFEQQARMPAEEFLVDT